MNILVTFVEISIFEATKYSLVYFVGFIAAILTGNVSDIGHVLTAEMI